MTKLKNNKISKGYRLRPETHEKIIMIKDILKSDTDYAIDFISKKFLEERNKKININK